MSNNGIVNIHGKEYMTVAKRVELAHGDNIESIETEVLQHSPVVVIKASVIVKGKKFNGISSANPAKAIEKSNPYEVAETSAVGRALGFAGYGIIAGIASADEMSKAISQDNFNVDDEGYFPQSDEEKKPDQKVCSSHEEPVVMFMGKSKTKTNEDGSPKTYYWHKGQNGEMCFGSGYKD